MTTISLKQVNLRIKEMSANDIGDKAWFDLWVNGARVYEIYPPLDEAYGFARRRKWDKSNTAPDKLYALGVAYLIKMGQIPCEVVE